MRVLLSIVTCLAISISSYAQDKITESFKLGDKGFSINAYQLFNGSKEHTFYEIKDGVLHYYYVSMYEGKYIQYNHASVAIKSLDLKNVSVQSIRRRERVYVP